MRKRSTQVAWGFLAAFAIIFVAANVLSAANGDSRTQPLLETVPLWLAFSAFMVVGALIVAHRPGNPIGWIFSAIALLAAGGGLAETYARYAYETRPGSLPGAIVATWFAWSSWYPTVALAVVFTPLLFPTGRLLSPRWRPVAWLTGPPRRRSWPWPSSSPSSCSRAAAPLTTQSGSPPPRTQTRVPPAPS